MQAMTHLIFRVDGHFESVSAQWHFRHVNPLAVDVVVVNVLAASGDALGAVVLAVVFRIHA